MNYKFSRDVIKKQHKHKWILLNTLNGESIVISNECFDILEMGINKSIVIDNIIDMLEDVEDKEYFKHLFSMLRNSNIIVNKHKKEKWEIDTISVDVTHRCNLNCLHCSACSGTIQEKEHLSTDTVIKILSDVIKLKPKNVCITGGEPLVRKDIWELLNYIKKNSNAFVSLMTNATLINERNVEELVKLVDAFDISIDGINEETCAKIRGKGVFDKVIRSIELLKRHGVDKISLSMVVVNHTRSYIKEFEDLNNKLGTYMMIREFEAMGRGKDNYELLVDHQEQKDKEKMIDLATTIGNENKNRGKGFSCGAARTSFFIDNLGNLFPCAPLNYNEFKLTNVIENPDFVRFILNEDYTNTKEFDYLLSLMPQNNIKCLDCYSNIFCWECLRDVYEKGRDKDKFDFRCQLKKLELKNIW